MQVWRSLVDTLRLLPTVSNATRASSEEDILRDVAQAQAEKKTLDDAIEKISILMALRLKKAGGSSPRISSPTPTPVLVSTGTGSGTGTGRSSTPLTGKQKKEMFGDQLPLQPGRKVVFRVPNEGWILAVVDKCIERDKMRYAVRDADEASTWVLLLLTCAL